MTIYTLMNKVHTLGNKVALAASCYREGKTFYADFECEALASLSILLDIDYITLAEYRELADQLHHVFRMYKRH